MLLPRLLYFHVGEGSARAASLSDFLPSALLPLFHIMLYAYGSSRPSLPLSLTICIYVHTCIHTYIFTYMRIYTYMYIYISFSPLGIPIRKRICARSGRFRRRLRETAHVATYETTWQTDAGSGRTFTCAAPRAEGDVQSIRPLATSNAVV